MLITKFVTAIVILLGLSQAFVIPETKPTEGIAGSSINELDLVSRKPQPVCSAKNPKTCTTCPRIQHIKFKKCVPRNGQKCPTGSSYNIQISACEPKRGNRCPPQAALKKQPPKKSPGKSPVGSNRPTKTPALRKSKKPVSSKFRAAALDKRVEHTVPMGGASMYSFNLGDRLSTKQVSACTFLAIWDTRQVFAANIPPGTVKPGGSVYNTADVLDESDTIDGFLARLDAQIRLSPLGHPRGGYLLIRDSADPRDFTKIMNWFAKYGVTPEVVRFTYKLGTTGYDVVIDKPQNGGPIKPYEWVPKVT